MPTFHKQKRFTWFLVEEDLRFLGGQSNTILLLAVHNQSVDLGSGVIFKHLHHYTLFTAVKHGVIGEHVIYSQATGLSHVLRSTPFALQPTKLLFSRKQTKKLKNCFDAFVKVTFTTCEAVVH
jgi:hypothetical protein